jgi:alcohol dehydrogenase
MYSKEAFKLIFNGLMKVLDEPANVQVRGDIALGAYFAGAALINAGSGPSGAFSYPLGAVYKVPHGYAGAIFLPSITKINVEKGYDDYAELYDLIDGADLTMNKKQKNTEFARLTQVLMDKLGVPRKLSAWNLGQKDIEFMIDQYDALKAAIDQNPIEITKDDVRKMMLELA